MILQLFGGRFRQWRCSTINGGKRDFRPPLPDDEHLPIIVEKYQELQSSNANVSYKSNAALSKQATLCCGMLCLLVMTLCFDVCHAKYFCFARIVRGVHQICH